MCEGNWSGTTQGLTGQAGTPQDLDSFLIQFLTPRCKEYQNLFIDDDFEFDDSFINKREEMMMMKPDSGPSASVLNVSDYDFPELDQAKCLDMEWGSTWNNTNNYG